MRIELFVECEIPDIKPEAVALLNHCGLDLSWACFFFVSQGHRYCLYALSYLSEWDKYGDGLEFAEDTPETRRLWEAWRAADDPVLYSGMEGSGVWCALGGDEDVARVIFNRFERNTKLAYPGSGWDYSFQ